ncbi:hypothetical protein [Humibacter sp.]|uniref:hypothetical protein n=1 Tax=Humibacter sp. TaxID=1940291 RepID=UPI003F8132BF
MDERRRLLERVFSREGAAEHPEEHRDPVTGETVRMTPSQWALAKYDWLHANTREDAADSEPTDADRRGADGDVAAPDASADIRSPEEEQDSGRGHVRRALPYLAAVGAFLLGVVLTMGVEAALGPRSHPESTVDSAVRGGVAPSPGDGDEAATLVAVTRYFANTPRVDDLPADATRGFDATSFHLVTGSAHTKTRNAIYAARRLDGEYCLVVVADAERAAETCGTLDDIARHGLSLTTDVASAIRTGTFAVTVIWATDGTISWKTGPFGD